MGIIWLLKLLKAFLYNILQRYTCRYHAIHTFESVCQECELMNVFRARFMMNLPSANALTTSAKSFSLYAQDEVSVLSLYISGGNGTGIYQQTSVSIQHPLTQSSSRTRRKIKYSPHPPTMIQPQPPLSTPSSQTHPQPPSDSQHTQTPHPHPARP